MYWLGKYLDPVTLTYILCSSAFYTFYVDVQYLLNYKAYNHQTLHSASPQCTDSAGTLTGWPWPIFRAIDFYIFYVALPYVLNCKAFNHQTLYSASSRCTDSGCIIRKVSAEDITIRGNGIGLEYMCPTRHFVYIFSNPVFQLSTAKNEINLFNNHVLIVAPVTFAPAGAMTPSTEFLSSVQLFCWISSFTQVKYILYFRCYCRTCCSRVGYRRPLFHPSVRPSVNIYVEVWHLCQS